jgi:hypothetical protein
MDVGLFVGYLPLVSQVYYKLQYEIHRIASKNTTFSKPRNARISVRFQKGKRKPTPYRKKYGKEMMHCTRLARCVQY